MCWLKDDKAFQLYRVSPFGYPRIVACVRLPEAFRRLLRPSSALYAKTSTVRSYSFNHFLAFVRELLTICLSTFSVNLVITTLRKRPIYCLLLLFSFQRTTLESLFEISQN